jgi:hypothetical protein
MGVDPAELKQSIIIKDRHSLRDEPSILSVYVNSLDISHDDLKAALVKFRACPETRQRFDAERDAVSRDIQLTKHSQATEMAKASGDSIMEDALRRISGRLVRRSAADSSADRRHHGRRWLERLWKIAKNGRISWRS